MRKKSIETGRLRVLGIVLPPRSSFSLGQLSAGPAQNSRCWVAKRCPKKNLQARDIVVGEKRWASSVMADAAISRSGCIEPRIIDRGVKIDASSYLDAVQNLYAPGMDLLYGGVGRFAFAQDNGPPRPHRVRRQAPSRPTGGLRVTRSTCPILRYANSLSAWRRPVKLDRLEPQNDGLAS